MQLDIKTEEDKIAAERDVVESLSSLLMGSTSRRENLKRNCWNTYQKIGSVLGLVVVLDSGQDMDPQGHPFILARGVSLGKGSFFSNFFFFRLVLLRVLRETDKYGPEGKHRKCARTWPEWLSGETRENSSIHRALLLRAYFPMRYNVQRQKHTMCFFGVS